MKPQQQDYQGRRLELREHDGRPELLIDGAQVRYGQLPDGAFFLDDYAFDWTDDLMELARRFVDYRRRVEAVQQQRAGTKTGGSNALP